MRKLNINKAFRDLIRPLTSDEFEQLESNILDEGCREPLIVWNGTIVDGHNRYKICTDHNIHFETTEIEFESEVDAKIWIIRNQIGRRNIEKGQRVMLVLNLKPLFEEKARQNQLSGLKQGPVPPLTAEREKPFDTRKEMAKAAQVSQDTIWKATKVVESGNDEVIDAVKDGKMTVGTAFKQITKVAEVAKDIEPEDNEPIDYFAKGKRFPDELRLKSPEEKEYEAAAGEYLHMIDVALRQPGNFNNARKSTEVYKLTKKIAGRVLDMLKMLESYH